jgi:hypothetical protein
VSRTRRRFSVGQVLVLNTPPCLERLHVERHVYLLPPQQARGIHLIEHEQDGRPRDSRQVADVVEARRRGAELKRVGHVYHVNHRRRVVQVLEQLGEQGTRGEGEGEGEGARRGSGRERKRVRETKNKRGRERDREMEREMDGQRREGEGDNSDRLVVEPHMPQK